MWVAQCEWGSAGLSAAVARLPPAKEEDVSPIPAAGISPWAEVRKEKAVGAGTGRVSQAGKWKSSRRAPRASTILAGLQAPSRLACCHSCGSMALPLGFQVLVHIQVFYLGRLGTVQQQLAWGSSHVYSQMPRHGPPGL